MKADNPEEAVDEFLGIPALEQDKSEWSVPRNPDAYWYLMLIISQGFQRIKTRHQAGIQTRPIWRCENAPRLAIDLLMDADNFELTRLSNITESS